MSEVLDRFSPATREWFGRLGAPTRVQELGWPIIAAGGHALLSAPTGSGKTLAAFLHCLDRLGVPGARTPGRTAVVYVSPLKALAYDVEKNLAAPLAAIARIAAERGHAFAPPTVATRTGDTTAAARRRQLREPPDILITTPESLYLLLTSGARETLRGVDTVIVDAIHALAPNKRGAHLALSLERLTALCAREPQRIGLSATQRPLEEVAHYLGGDREVAIVDAGEAPRLDLAISVPVDDMARPGEAAGPDASPQERASILPAIYRLIAELVAQHRSTIVFVNNRRQAERIAHHLNQGGADVARAHHGSVARPERVAAEELLKRGALRCIAATSSLELGIDMSAVDLVIQVESPGSVARGLQRVGRAGHAVGATSRGRVLPVFRGDLLESAAVVRGMLDGDVEPIATPRQPLDVLAQQIVAMAAVEPWPVDALAALVRRAWSYRELSREVLESVLGMLAGAYPSDDMAALAPRLAWDRTAGEVVGRRGARIVALTSGGTIPDRGLYPVHVGAPDGPRVGELDEEMVHESRAGDTFLLGATTWRIQEISRDRIIVTPAPGEPGRMPFWKGDRPGRPAALGRRVGALAREVGGASRAEAARFLAERHLCDARAAANLWQYLAEQREATGALPTDRAITIERFRDELGDFRVCLLTPMGARVHAPWAMAIEEELAPALGAPIQVMWNDDGIAFRLPGAEQAPDASRLLVDPDEVEERVTRRLATSALFASRFRENAARALLLPRRRPGQRTPLWTQRLRAQQLLGAAQRHPDFPIVLETYREILRDVFDLPALVDLLRAIRGGAVDVDVVDTPVPSPFARALAFAYTMAFMYEGDAPAAERRAQALALDRTLLRDLLGEADLRGLLDAEAVDEVERERQALAPGWRARGADEVEDLLRRLGPLSHEELAERAEGDAAAWGAELVAQGRAARVVVAGEPRLAAAADCARLSDALERGDDEALDELLRRHARGRGPFQVADAAARFGVDAARATAALDRLVARGQLERGALRPGAAGVDLCDVDVLRQLRRRTLDRLRDRIAPVEPAALGRFLPAWHGIGRAGAGARGLPPLRAALRRLAGAPLLFEELERRILPARVADYHPRMLDELGAAGELVWVGAGAGRVALYDREHLALIPEGVAQPGAPSAPQHLAVLGALASRGASFQVALEEATALPRAELIAALWDLIWAGLVTNDTFAPLRPTAMRKSASTSSKRSTYFAGGGRWSLVAQRGRGVDPSEAALGRALALLERHGILGREAVAAEEIAGGFAALAPVLRLLEETGRARRGTFVAGLDGRQYALPEALDRLRADAGEPAAVVLAATDPANPYGAALEWPVRADGGRPARRAGVLVMLWGGHLAWTWERGGRALWSTAGRTADELGACLQQGIAAAMRLARRRSLRIDTIDGVAARESPLAPALLGGGFRVDARALSRDE
ncbi:MAG TPA: DEAD/DEAH box helicase [Kofleriaceae bacterium]|nr:DEAD/DEAH box helicase [Kofleriaceae bacterium]